MKRQVRLGVKTLLVSVLALLGVTPALAVIDHPFSTVNANVISSSTATSLSSGGSLQYLVRFTLDGGTDFYDPGTEQLSIIGKPDATNPLEASLPRSFVIIPAGCFTATTIGTTSPISLINSTVGDLSCGVQVQLFDPATSGVSDLNGSVTGFTARMVLSSSTNRGFLKVQINFSGFNPATGMNPGRVSIRLGSDGSGSDGVQDLPISSSVSGKGSN